MSDSNFKRMWNRQRQQQSRIFKFVETGDMDVLTRRKIIQDNLLGIHEEVAELQRHLYKGAHVLNRQESTENNIALAGVDVLKYLISLMIASGVSPDAFESAFFSKSDVVDEKLDQERAEISAGRVLVTDLDGVLALYHAGLESWLHEKKLWDYYHRHQMSAESVKHRFYDEGGFLGLEPVGGAQEAIAEIRRMGIKVAIITSRPRWQHERIHHDTMIWLRNHGIEYDAIFWGKNKADLVMENIWPAEVLLFIEDRPKHVIDLHEAGLKVAMFASPDNEGIQPPLPLIKKYNRWADIVEHIKNTQP